MILTAEDGRKFKIAGFGQVKDGQTFAWQGYQVVIAANAGIPENHRLEVDTWEGLTPSAGFYFILEPVRTPRTIDMTDDEYESVLAGLEARRALD